MDYDLNKDGIVSENEAELMARINDLENLDKKADQQRRMAWIAMISMLIITFALFLPVVPDSRAEILSDLVSMFYVANAGIIAAFFGVEAYTSINKPSVPVVNKTRRPNKQPEEDIENPEDR